MPSLPRAFRLFRAFKVSVYLDYSWFLFFFLVVWTFGQFYFPQFDPAFSTAASWVFAVVAALLLFGSVIFHEMSHALISNRLGFPIRRITLFIFGGVAHMHSEPKNARTEFLVAGAGPLSSLFLWMAFSFFYGAFEIAGLLPAMAVAKVTADLNLALALFNLVPGFPLDGGRLLRSAVWWKTGSLRKATNIAVKGGEAFAYFLMVLGVIMIYVDRTASGWVGGIWYILIGVFLKNAAEQSYQHVLMEEVLEGIYVSEIMGTNVMSVSGSQSLDELVEQKFLHHKFPAYPVLDQQGKVVGVVDLEQVKNVPKDQRDERTVIDVMQSIPVGQLPRPSTLAFDALKGMLTLGVGRLPVVDETGHLAGIVTRGDIMSMFQIRSDLGDEIVI